MAMYGWASDVHLDFLRGDSRQLVAFAESLVANDPTGIFLTGDVSNSKELVFHLSAIERVVQRPVYFVLGNHDFYSNSIEEVRKQVNEVSNVSSYLKHVMTIPYVALTPQTALVGADGWYDAYNGDWRLSSFEMNDWRAIAEFYHVRGSKQSIVNEARRLSLESATHVHDSIKKAVKYHKNVIVLTHVPPFKESHIYEGRVSDDGAQPWFTSQLMGNVLLDAAKAFPAHSFKVLCGHTHGEFHGAFANNLEVHVAGAEYGKPRLQGLVEVL